MLKIITSLLLFILCSSLSWGFTKERLVLKGGVSLAHNNVGGLQDTSDNFVGAGLNTHFGYRKNSLEYSLSSITQFSSMDPVAVSPQGSSFKQGGSFLDFSVLPILKYHTTWQPKKNWNFYFGLGPSWSLQSIRQEKSTPKSKIVYQSFGGNLIFGIEEMLIYEKMHPVFLELTLSHRKSDRVSLVDVTDFSKVKTLSEASVGDDFEQTSITLSLGITLF